jgi:hypothetical protein
MIVLDKLGWPVELYRDRPIINLIRLFVHGRKIVRTWVQPTHVDGCPVVNETEFERLREQAVRECFMTGEVVSGNYVVAQVLTPIR